MEGANLYGGATVLVLTCIVVAIVWLFVQAGRNQEIRRHARMTHEELCGNCDGSGWHRNRRCIICSGTGELTYGSGPKEKEPLDKRWLT